MRENVEDKRGSGEEEDRTVVERKVRKGELKAKVS